MNSLSSNQPNMKASIITLHLALGEFHPLSAADPSKANPEGEMENSREIKSYCLEFNWAQSARSRPAKDGNPNCITWPTSNNINHPHVINADN